MPASWVKTRRGVGAPASFALASFALGDDAAEGVASTALPAEPPGVAQEVSSRAESPTAAIGRARRRRLRAEGTGDMKVG